MSIREDIKMLLAKKAMTMTELADKMSTREKSITVYNLSKKLRLNTIKFEEVRTILEILGYDIVYKEKVCHDR